jgi:hypothetical protein
MAINYDPSAHGGAAFGNADYEHLKSQGHSDSAINNFIGGLDNSKVSNKYKGKGGHQRTESQATSYQAKYGNNTSQPTAAPTQAKEAPTQAQKDALAKAEKHTAEQEKIAELTENKKGPGGGGINYDPSQHGGAAFGTADYDHLKSQGHSDDDINSYIGGLDNSKVSNKYKGRGGHERNETQQANHDNKYFTTAAGYEMERGAYNQSLRNMSDDREASSKEKYGDNHNSWGYGDSAHYANFDQDGYLNHDSTKVQWQNQNMLKEAGYKVGDTLWKPGAKDDLNGRTLTGKIARITESGIFIPEYEHDAINSSHQSTGNAGYQGEVGLGADQYNYNRQYEQENDVTPGQVNQQIENNNGPEDVEPITTKQDPASSGVALDTGSTTQDFSSNMFSGMNRQTGYKGLDMNDLQSAYTKLGFNFDPNRFNTQGQ